MRLLTLLLLLVLGCGDLDPDPASPTNDPTSDKKEKFVWDFNSNNVYAYSFEQKTVSINDWGWDNDAIDTSRTSAHGDLKIKSKGNNKADFVLTELKLESDLTAKMGDDYNFPSQTLVIQDLNANGSFEARTADARFLFDLIFPLPSFDLKTGQKEKIALQIPYNLMGSPLFVKGTNEMQYLKNARKGGSKVAILRSKFKVDQLEVPEEIKGEFSFSLNGEAEYAFNYQDHYFLSAEIDLEIAMSIKLDSEKDMMGKMEMKTENISSYVINFLSIER